MGNDKLDNRYLGKVVTRFLAMPVCNIATGQGLFDDLEAEL